LINAVSRLELNLASGASTFNNVITGSGGVTKLGAGIVNLNGINNYSGGTDIVEGALRITDIASLGTGPVGVQSGAFLDFDVATNSVWNAAISGAGTLRKSGTGELTLLSNTLSGGLDIQEGRVSVSDVSALGTGAVTLANTNTSLLLNASNTQVMSTSISGTGRLVKEGVGVVVIQNANSFSGGTTINAGRIGLNNGLGLGTGAITLAAGAELGIGGVTLANNVSGAGKIIKTSNNVGILTGTNTHSGGTNIDGGTIQVASVGALGSGGVAIASGANLTTQNNSNETLANTISGAGSVTKQGSGVLTVTGSNSYSGPTLVQAGRLHVGAANALGAGTASIASGAQLSFGDLTFANNVSGAGVLIKTGSGAGSLTGANTHTGGTLVSSGTLNVSNLAPLGTGAVQVDTGSTLVMTNIGNLAFTNALGGAGSFQKIGTGQLLFGSNFAIGNLLIDAGSVRLNSIAHTNATIGTSGTLDGTGRIIGSLINNGTVAPGNSIGTLTVQGNYTSSASSILEIEFDGAGNIDLLDVTGGATLNGGTLRFKSIGGAEGSGGTFLRTGGSLTGTFATIETIGAALPLSVIYESNAAKMAPSVLTARPSTFNAQVIAASDTALSFAGSLDAAAANAIQGRQVWVQGFASNAERSESGTTLAYDHKSSGLSFGVSAPVNAYLSLGAAYGWSKSDITLGSGAGGGAQDTHLGSAYLKLSTKSVGLSAGAFYGKVEQETLRNVSFNGFAGSVSGSGDADLAGAFAGITGPLGELGPWAMSGVGRLTYVKMSQDTYSEAGSSPLRLDVAARDVETLESQIGLQGNWGKKLAERGGDISGARIDIKLEGGYRYVSAQDDRVIPVKFAVSNAGIDLQGDARDSGYAFLGSRLDWKVNSRSTLNMGYLGHYGDTNQHTIQLGYRFAF
jgi:autotransporter-associated beta strand protein